MTTKRTTEEILNEIQDRLAEVSKQLAHEFADADWNYETEVEKAQALSLILRRLYFEIGDYYSPSGWRPELDEIR